MKLDKKDWSFGTFAEAQKEQTKELNRMSYQEKSRTITLLRECFFGPKATTGRVQRVFELCYKSKLAANRTQDLTDVEQLRRLK